MFDCILPTGRLFFLYSKAGVEKLAAECIVLGTGESVGLEAPKAIADKAEAKLREAVGSLP